MHAIIDPPARFPSRYFAPVFYSLSGRVRVSRRSDECQAEIIVAPHCWAEIEGGAGDFDHALRAALACDPLSLWRD